VCKLPLLLPRWSLLSSSLTIWSRNLRRWRKGGGSRDTGRKWHFVHLKKVLQLRYPKPTIVALRISDFPPRNFLCSIKMVQSFHFETPFRPRDSARKLPSPLTISKLRVGQMRARASNVTKPSASLSVLDICTIPTLLPNLSTNTKSVIEPTGRRKEVLQSQNQFGGPIVSFVNRRSFL